VGSANCDKLQKLKKMAPALSMRASVAQASCAFKPKIVLPKTGRSSSRVVAQAQSNKVMVSHVGSCNELMVYILGSGREATVANPCRHDVSINRAQIDRHNHSYA
jgi:hypothetical protein